jgi:hypothetical protein
VKTFPPGLRVLGAVLALAGPAARGGGFKPGPGWPEVATPFFHAANPPDGAARIRRWREIPGCSVQGYRDSGSMHPVLQGGRELLALERCRAGTPLAPGQVVLYDRGDVRAVVHYIAAISRNGKQVYLTGVNCRNSDGWFSRDRIAWVVREIITLPDPRAGPAPAPAARPAR